MTETAGDKKGNAFIAKLKAFWNKTSSPANKVGKGGLRTLVTMQLKEQSNFKMLSSPKMLILGVLFTAAKFALVTAVIYALFSLGVTLQILSNVPQIPAFVLVFLYGILLILSTVAATASLVKSLYLAGDNFLLLTLPVSPNMVFLSKMIVFYIGELKRNLFTLMPIFLAYGVYNGLDPAFYVILIVSFFFLTLIPVVLGAILSIPGLFLYQLLKDQKVFLFIVAAGIGTAIVVFVFKLASNIPKPFDYLALAGRYYMSIRNFLTNFYSAAVPFRYVTEMVIGFEEGLTTIAINGTTAAVFFSLLGILAAGGTGAFFLQRYLFFLMASKPNEYKKVVREAKKNVPLSPALSGIKKSALALFRTPEVLISTYFMVFAMPFLIYLQNSIFTNMNTRITGDYLVMGFNVLMMLLLSLSNNTSTASVLSQEGSAAPLLKSQPTKITELLFGKLAIHIFLMLACVVSSCAIMGVLTEVTAVQTTMLFFTVLLINLAHIMMAVESDILKPQYKKYFGGQPETLNPNELKSAGLTFLLAIIFFGISVFLLYENSVTAWYKILAIAAGFFAMRLYLFINRIRVYYKEF